MSSTKRLLETLSEELAREYCRRNQVDMSPEIVDDATLAIISVESGGAKFWQPWVKDWVKKQLNENQVSQ
jgi:hypothetical protein